jgi:hypothetical protein
MVALLDLIGMGLRLQTNQNGTLREVDLKACIEIFAGLQTNRLQIEADNFFIFKFSADRYTSPIRVLLSGLI